MKKRREKERKKRLVSLKEKVWQTVIACFCHLIIQSHIFTMLPTMMQGHSIRSRVGWRQRHLKLMDTMGGCSCNVAIACGMNWVIAQKTRRKHRGRSLSPWK